MISLLFYTKLGKMFKKKLYSDKFESQFKTRSYRGTILYMHSNFLKLINTDFKKYRLTAKAT